MACQKGIDNESPKRLVGGVGALAQLMQKPARRWRLRTSQGARRRLCRSKIRFTVRQIEFYSSQVERLGLPPLPVHKVDKASPHPLSRERYYLSCWRAAAVCDYSPTSCSIWSIA